MDEVITALHRASEYRHLDYTKHLISQGADANTGDTDGSTELHSAAFHGHLNVTKYLISQGADVNNEKNDGWTALHSAAFSGHLNVIKYLISQGSDVNKGDNDDWTALHSAAQEGYLDVTQCLISQGAIVNKGDNNGRTALHIASQKGHLDVTKYLISHGAEVNNGRNDGWTVLHTAAFSGHLDVTKYLISQGADVNKGDNYGRIALHSAAFSGHLDVTGYLISQGAEVNKGNNEGRTPLHHAVQNGYIDVVKALLAGGARSETGDINGHTPLHLSSSLGYQNIADLLIDLSNSKLDQNDLTDIHLAIQNGHTSTIEKLISEGSDLNVQTTDGQTCLHKAIKLCYNSDRTMHDTDTLKEISNKYYKGELSPEKALVFYLLENGAKIDVRDKSGNLPIQYANDEVVKQMILSRVTTEAEKNDYDNLPEKAHSDTTDSAKPISHALDGRYATGTFGALGGTLSTESHGFTLHIPPGALEEDEEIGLQVLTEFPNGLTLETDELLVSHGFQCYPSGLRFKKPAKLIIPHCALVTAPNKVQTILYSWNQSGTPKRLPDSSNIICSVQERWLEVSISHFSGGFFAVLLDWLFMNGIVLSCMAFLPRLLPFSRKPILDVRFAKKPYGQHWKDVHELDDPRFQHVKGDDDDILFLQGTLNVACQLGEKSLKSEAIQFSDMRSHAKVTKYFDLDLTKEREETLVTLKLVQNSTQTIKFNTCFQGIAKETTEQNAFSPAIDEIPTEESREHDFDDLLKTIAKRIHKVDDIDSLGSQLGFEPPLIQSYIHINTRYHTVSCMGTLSMLRDWRNRTKRSEEREKLSKALIAINHQRLADDLLNDDNGTSV